MSLEQFEQSVEAAQPLFLYKFTLGTRTWRYTSAATDELTQDGFLWIASAISHQGVRQSGEAASDTLQIAAPVTIGPVQVYMINPPTAPITVSIFQKDAADNEVVCIYVGDVSQVNFPEPGKAAVSCDTLAVSLKREGLRLTWQRSCPYALYDPLTCQVNKGGYAVPVVVESINRFDVTVSGPTLTAGIYAGGFLEWQHPVKGTEFLAIEKQTGSVLTIFGTTVDLYVGMTLILYRGCNRTIEACQQFGNTDNYGGIPGLPGKSPFDGTPVF